MSSLHIAGLLASVLLIAGLAVFSGTKAHKAPTDGNGLAIVAGIIMGTLVGGSSTVGTAQLAYQYGMSAWWFTLGGGIACLILALVYGPALRRSACPTLVGMICLEYGPAVGLTASVLNAVGTFINILSQLLAASAVVLVVRPQMETFWTLALSAGFMVLYVVFGGTRGAGIVGILKLVLLYVSMAVCGALAVSLAGGPGTFLQTVRSLCSETGVSYFSLLARGAGEDLGACLSLILGVLTTQTYAQAMISAESGRAARLGGLLSAFLIPPIGVCGIVVGLYMRSVTDPAVFSAKTALTQFALDHLPPLLGGVVLGTLFIASVGTGAGLALGISSIVEHDIIRKFTHRFDAPQRSALLSKGLIIAVLAVGCALSAGPLGDMILSFAFMSMGLRGAVVFLPLCFALWLPGRVRPGFAMASVILGPLLVLLFGTVFSGLLPFDALFAGVLASAAVMFSGLPAGGRSASDRLPDRNG